MPNVFAAVGIKGDNGGEKKIIATARTAQFLVPRRAVTDADVQQVQVRIVDHGIPGSTSAAIFPPFAPPGLGGLLHRRVFKTVGGIAGHGVKPPDHLAGVGSIGRNITSHAQLGSAIADYTVIFDDARRAGNGVGLLPVGGLYIPQHFAVLRVESDQAAIEGADKYFAVMVSNAAICCALACAGVASSAACVPQPDKAAVNNDSTTSHRIACFMVWLQLCHIHTSNATDFLFRSLI